MSFLNERAVLEPSLKLMKGKQERNASQPASARNSPLPTKPECHTDRLPLPHPPRLPNRMELNPVIRFDSVPELQKKTTQQQPNRCTKSNDAHFTPDILADILYPGERNAPCSPLPPDPAAPSVVGGHGYTCLMRAAAARSLDSVQKSCCDSCPSTRGRGKKDRKKEEKPRGSGLRVLFG